MKNQKWITIQMCKGIPEYAVLDMESNLVKAVMRGRAAKHTCDQVCDVYNKACATGDKWHADSLEKLIRRLDDRRNDPMPNAKAAFPLNGVNYRKWLVGLAMHAEIIRGGREDTLTMDQIAGLAIESADAVIERLDGAASVEG